MKKFLYWAPRTLSILLAAFVSIFSFDVFDAGYSGWQLVLALFIHLLPTFVLIIFITIAWKWEKIGGLLFILLGIAFVFIGGYEVIAILLFTIPFIIVGGMFLLHSRTYSKESRNIDPNQRRTE
jgi:membrane-bound ClpP family serine protease